MALTRGGKGLPSVYLTMNNFEEIGNNVLLFGAKGYPVEFLIGGEATQYLFDAVVA